ncbi:MAG: trigger factor [Chloroflexi bacterium]|nr:MAG: trigger factor [Chloroflexota bacterium]
MITTESLEHRQLRLTIELGEEKTQQAMHRMARKISKQINIPGFRKGKAPYELVLQRYGEETVRQEAADDMVEQVYREALKQEEIQPYAPAVLEKTTLDPITFEFTIPLPPQVSLGDYRDYRLKPHKVRIYKKEVQQALAEIREQNAILEPVERPVALGDGALIDLHGQTNDGTKVISGDDVRIILDAESTNPAPGFAQAIVGMEAGEERTLTLPLPADFPKEELRGREVEFTVKMKEVYDSTLPALDDDLARTVGNFDSLKELEAHVKEQLRQKAQQETDKEYTAQVLEAIIEQAQVEYPPVMLQDTLDEMIKEVEQMVKRETQLSLEDYLRFQGKTLDETQEELKPSADTRLKRALVLGKVVALEKLEIDEEEITSHIQKVSAQWGARADEVRTSLSSGAGRDGVIKHLLTQKAVQRLVAIAKGEAPELVSKETEEQEERK